MHLSTRGLPNVETVPLQRGGIAPEHKERIRGEGVKCGKIELTHFMDGPLKFGWLYVF